jgi:hypothetical protein
MKDCKDSKFLLNKFHVMCHMIPDIKQELGEIEMSTDAAVNNPMITYRFLAMSIPVQHAMAASVELLRFQDGNEGVPGLLYQPVGTRAFVGEMRLLTTQAREAETRRSTLESIAEENFTVKFGGTKEWDRPPLPHQVYEDLKRAVQVLVDTTLPDEVEDKATIAVEVTDFMFMMSKEGRAAMSLDPTLFSSLAQDAIAYITERRRLFDYGTEIRWEDRLMYANYPFCKAPPTSATETASATEFGVAGGTGSSLAGPTEAAAPDHSSGGDAGGAIAATSATAGSTTARLGNTGNPPDPVLSESNREDKDSGDTPPSPAIIEDATDTERLEDNKVSMTELPDSIAQFGDLSNVDKLQMSNTLASTWNTSARRESHAAGQANETNEPKRTKSLRYTHRGILECRV